MKCHRQTQDRENVNQTCIDIKKYLVLCLVPNKLMMQCTTLNSEQFQEIIFCENYLIVRPATTFNFFFVINVIMGQNTTFLPQRFIKQVKG